MSAQQLFHDAPDENKLTVRQAAALELVRTTAGGIQAVDVGIALHKLRPADRFACSCKTAERPCQYALSAGHQVLKRLRQFGYGLVRRKTGLWVIPNTTPPAPGSEISGPGGLPEGF